jgi:hypothetical protein
LIFNLSITTRKRKERGRKVGRKGGRVRRREGEK